MSRSQGKLSSHRACGILLRIRTRANTQHRCRSHVLVHCRYARGVMTKQLNVSIRALEQSAAKESESVTVRRMARLTMSYGHRIPCQTKQLAPPRTPTCSRI